jgi:hypothetical protein
MIWVILGLLFVFILFMSGQDDRPDEKEDEFLEDELLEFELLEDEILLYYDEEDLFDDEEEHS